MALHDKITNFLDKNAFTTLFVLAITTLVIVNYCFGSDDDSNDSEKKPAASSTDDLVALDKQIYTEFKLVEKIQANHNTVRLQFATPHHNQVLGLSLGQCISVRVVDSTG
ncbi:NADH-cytochrome b5 reductase 1, partial [Smittium mucronatum]